MRQPESFFPAKERELWRATRRGQHQRQHKRMLQNKTQHRRDEKEEEEEKEKGGGTGSDFFFFFGWTIQMGIFAPPPKKKTSKLRWKILPNFPRKITCTIHTPIHTHAHPYIHVVIHVCKLNPLCLNYIHGCFFWVDVLNVFFFPEFFCHFWDKHIVKVFGKKFNLFCNFLGEQFTKKIYTKKKILICILIKKP